MVCYSLAAATSVVGFVACFERTAAFAPPLAAAPRYGSSATRTAAGLCNHSGPRLQRIPRSSVKRRGAQRLSMRHATASSAASEEQDSRAQGSTAGNNHHDRGLTRLAFGLGVGAAAGTALLLPRQAFAEEEGDVISGDAAPVVAEASQAMAPEAVPAATPEMPPLRDLGFEVPYTGKSLPLSKFLGSRATLVVNPKIDDPESLHQMPGITKMAADYGTQGLNVLLFPTDQGTFEADEDRVVRIKFYQFYGFGQYPRAVVFDKVDIVGSTIHPFYRYLCKGLKNPNGIARITLNYEKFLLDKDGKVVRRYPRKLEAADFERDVQALLADQPLPVENRDYKLSWLKADQEASKSEYAFKLGLNYYNN